MTTTHPLREMTITIGSPGKIAGEEGRRVLAAFYGELLGMQVVDEGWLRIAVDRTSVLRFALDSDGWSDQRPPRWNDPEHPQQLHLDIEVQDLDRASELVTSRGATLLHEVVGDNAGGGDSDTSSSGSNGSHRTFADPAGHPFCLYPAPATSSPSGAVTRRLVFDCFSPRSLSSFYEGLFGLGASARTTDTPERVVLALGDGRFPDFAFQHAQFVAPRWPDPAYPAQLHVDVRFTEGAEAAADRAERLGAIRLPKLADTEIFADPAGHPFCI